MLTIVLITPFLFALFLLLLGKFFNFRIKLENKVGYIISCTPAALCAFIALKIWLNHLEGQNFELPGSYWFNWFNSYIMWEVNLNLVSVSMLLLVNLVGFIVLIFSSIYMYEERNLTTFFSYVYLFIGFMNILVFAENLVQFFVGWEGIGICSFLLIGFWNGRFSASKAAFYAMLINKIGDICLILAMCFVMHSASLTYLESGSNEVIYVINGYEITLQEVICCLLITSVFCKSAQIIFHGWLPDAMEGPTPVSALIHAATMVTAGNLLAIKLSPYWVQYNIISQVLIVFGGFTCIIASMIAFSQVDIKKVVAYSTCSQLGYMVLACGLAKYIESLVHCLSHGFFKALLFLASGWIIYVYRHNQSSEKMGGKGLLSVELIYFIIGSGSLVAIPLTSGWYSKEIIIMSCIDGYSCAILSFIAWVAAILTSLYSTKVIYRAFFKSPKDSSVSNENYTEKEVKSGLRWGLSFQIIVSLSLFFLTNFALFFGFYNSVRNFEFNINYLGLTSMGVIYLCIYLGILGIVLRVFSHFLKFSKTILTLCKEYLEFAEVFEAFLEFRMSIRNVKKLFLIKNVDHMERRLIIKSLLSLKVEDILAFLCNIIVKLGQLLIHFVFLVIINVSNYLNKKLVLVALLVGCTIIYYLELLLLMPIISFIFFYSFLTTETVIALAGALHFAEVIKILWYEILSIASWFNERFEKFSYVLVHTLLKVLLGYSKELNKFLKNNISGWAFISFIIILVVAFVVS